MARPQAENIVVIGAGAAGLSAARELGRAGKRVTILEARDRCGGRIHPLPSAEFGYPAEGGAEFVHGEAPMTHHAGDPVVEIVDDDYRAQVDQAQANVVAAAAAIDNIEQQKRLQETLVKQAEAEIQASEAYVTRYHLEAVRQETLLSKSYAGTPQLTEQAVDNEKHAVATLALNRAKLEQQRQQVNVLEAQAAAALEAQKAAQNLAEINLGYTRITAPVDGMVSERRVRPGQYLSVSTQVISLVPLPNVWVIANYKETQMTNIRTGQRARVTVDAFPGKVLHGQVDSWSPASGAQFALLPPDSTHRPIKRTPAVRLRELDEDSY